MEKKRKRGITIRLGPLGLSLLAAGITAVGLAAVSLADNGSGTGAGNGNQTFHMPAPPPGAGGATVFRSNLSAADQKKMEEFRQCMQANGAPGPPSPGDLKNGPPKPPSAVDHAKIDKAWQACKDKLPQDMQNAGPPRIGTCGPPPGAPPRQGQSQGGQNQSNQSGTSSSGSSS